MKRIEPSRRWRSVRRAAVVGLLLVVPGADLGAQSQDATEGSRQIGCLRGRQLPACKSFWIVEMQGSVPILETERLVQYSGVEPQVQETFKEVVEWNVGHMVNVGSTWAIGGVITAGSGNKDFLTGIKARVRRWFSPNVSVEFEGGVLRTNGNGPSYGLVGSTADVRLNVRDQGSFFVRWDGVSLPERINQNFGSSEPASFQHGLSVGASAGSVPGLIASAAMGIIYGAIFLPLADS